MNTLGDGGRLDRHTMARSMKLNTYNVHGSLIVSGRLVVNGTQLPERQTLFDASTTDTVQNPIGSVSASTVEQLRAQYPDVGSVVKDMLQIAPVPTSLTVTYIVATSGAVTEYLDTRLNATTTYEVEYTTNQTSTDITWNGASTTVSPQTIVASSEVHAPTVFELIPFAQRYPNATVPDRAPVLRSYAHVYRNTMYLDRINDTLNHVNSTAVGVSGIAGTSRVYLDTQYAYITNHHWADMVEVGRNPTSVAQYQEGLNVWNEMGFATTAPTDRTTPIWWKGVFQRQNRDVWLVLWYGPERKLADVRITF
jgi:hypothetical protein